MPGVKDCSTCELGDEPLEHPVCVECDEVFCAWAPNVIARALQGALLAATVDRINDYGMSVAHCAEPSIAKLLREALIAYIGLDLTDEESATSESDESSHGG